MSDFNRPRALRIVIPAFAWLVLTLPLWSEEVNYEDDVLPIFRGHCLKCHNSDESDADLDLSSYESVLKGGSSGAVVKAGQPESSQFHRVAICPCYRRRC